MKIGKLYKCPDRYLLIIPTREIADRLQVEGGTMVGPPRSVTRAAATQAYYWSKKLSCTVRFSEPNEVFLCLDDQEGEYIHGLFGEKQGWITNKSWLKIERVK